MKIKTEIPPINKRVIDNMTANNFKSMVFGLTADEANEIIKKNTESINKKKYSFIDVFNNSKEFESAVLDYEKNIKVGFKNAKDFQDGNMHYYIEEKEIILGSKSKHKKKYSK